MEATKELLKMLLPEDLRDSFEIVDVKKVSWHNHHHIGGTRPNHATRGRA